jgi:hypothetical protein
MAAKSGETDLNRLLAGMAPEPMPGDFVFCSFPGGRYGDHAELGPVAAVREAEGLTLVIPRPSADAHNLAYSSVLRGITLTVHSSLEAVGLTAAVAHRLSAEGISANVVAGYYHDHVFVQSEHAARAVAALRALAAEAAGEPTGTR